MDSNIQTTLQFLNSNQQKVVYSNSRRLLCLAGAGTGKTYTMIAKVLHLVDDLNVDPASILCLTFTHAAATEMEARYRKQLSNANIPYFGTFHAFCYWLLCRDKEVLKSIGYTTVPQIIDENEEELVQSKTQLLTSVKLPKYKCKITYKPKTTEKFQWEVYQKKFDQLLRKENKITFDRLCYRVCELFSNNDTSVIKYIERFKYIMVDEFQDTDPLQWEFVQSFEDSSIMVVGDVRQCQPAGTQVTMADLTTKSIEDIKVGDYVTTYNRREGRYIKTVKNHESFLQRYCGQVTEISKHQADNIVEVKTAQHSSKYTKDHLTYAKIHYEGFENSYVVYLMCNDKGWWRVGKTKLFLESQQASFGPRNRLKAEKGSAIWILDIVEESNKAWLIEQAVAYKFGIPQTTWEVHNVTYSYADIQILYDNLENIEEKAIKCLEYFGRDIRYPLWTSGDLHKHFSKLHLFPIQVGNLIPKFMDVAIPQYKSESTTELYTSYEQILAITPVEPQLVYGLNITKYHNYISDGILTHNCIYEFRGADSSIIKSISTDSDWDVIKLEDNYRSTIQICQFANDIVDSYDDDIPDIALKSVKSGPEVDTISFSKLIHNLVFSAYNEGSTAVLARTNKEVDSLKLLCMRRDIPFITKRDIAKESELLSALNDNFRKTYLLSLLPSKDKIEVLRKVYLDPSFDINPIFEIKLPEVCAHIQNLQKSEEFEEIERLLAVGQLTLHTAITQLYNQTKDSNFLYLGTIHSVKGLEFDSVYLIVNSDYGFDLSKEEHKNLYYVGCTRPKTNLTIVTS